MARPECTRKLLRNGLAVRHPAHRVLTKFYTASRSLFIRTMTVGPGITPGLLTLSMKQEKHGFIDKRSRTRHIACHYRR
jgi:hypothetical protein